MCLFSESSCALRFHKYRETLSLKTCTSLKTRTYVHKIRSAAQNVFWFPMLCVCGAGVYMLCKRIFSLCLVAKT